MPDSERLAAETRSFLDDHPDVRPALQTVVARDRADEPWTFDEIDLDSGRFGELVSRGIAEQTGDGYQLADRAAVTAALNGERIEPDAADTATNPLTGLSAVRSRLQLLSSVNWTVLLALTAVLALVGAGRSIYYSSVFRNNAVVSPANDPYYFRFFQSEFLDQSTGPADVSMLSAIGAETSIRPLAHAVNWWFAELLGPATVAAWLPVALAVVLGGVLYGLAVTLTADHRIGLAAVLLYALSAVHVVYTSLGFIDHNPHQYLWLGVLALSLVWLARDLQRRVEREPPDAQSQSARSAELAHALSVRAWAVAGVLAVAVAATAHAWGGSPMMFVPVALYLAGRVLSDVDRGVAALPANAPALGGIAVGAGLAALAHVRWEWHESIAVTTPTLVAVGGVVIATVGTLWHRLTLPTTGLAVVEAAVAAVGGVGYTRLRPDDFARIQDRADDLFFRESAIETGSLFTTDYAVILGPLWQVGVSFYLGLIPLGLATGYVYRRYEPAWLVVVVFTWTWLAFAAIQVRFAAQFAVFAAVFGGIGLVYLLGAVNLIRQPRLFAGGLDGPAVQLPASPGKAGYLALVLVVVLGVNLVFVPTLLADVQYDGDQTDAAFAINDHATAHDRDYPANRVISQWGDQRMYNYLVSGESQSYDRSIYDQSFVSTTDPDAWAQGRGNVGYVVVLDQSFPDGTTPALLFDEYGLGADAEAGATQRSQEALGHYQLVYDGDDARAFALVEGAVVETTVAPNASVTATTNITAGGEPRSYRRTATADASGNVSIRVAYSGEYTVAGTTITVSPSAVENGTVVSTGARTASE